MQKSVIQRENGNFKRKTCYPTRQIVIQGENVLSNVKTCYNLYIMENVIQRKKHVILCKKRKLI